MTDWIRVENDRLVCNGRPVRLKGTNFQTWDAPWRTFEAYPLDSIEAGLDDAAALGCNCLRTWIPIGKPEEQERFADFVDRAERRGLRIYASFSWKAKYGRPAAAFEEDLRDLAAVSRAWRNDPRIFAWDLVNEPDWVSHDEWQWSMNPEAAESRIDWLLTLMQTIRGEDGNHPISVGMIFNDSWWTPRAALRLLDAVDFVDFHYYRRNYRDRSLADALGEARAHTGKPLLVGELGMSTDPTFVTEGEPVHNEAVQEEVYRGFARDLAEADNVGCLQWTLYDYVGLPPELGETHYGILRADRSRKPAALVFRKEFRAAL